MSSGVGDRRGVGTGRNIPDVARDLGIGWPEEPRSTWRLGKLHRTDAPICGNSAVAAISCGTNSTRLLVADSAGAPLVRDMRITRLGMGVDATRRLAPEAIDRTLAVLREYRRAIEASGATRIRMTATSAVRDAINRENFVTAAEQAAGVPLELLEGEEEARLSFRSATAELDAAQGPFLVVDIGGGSTELAVGPAGRRREPEDVRSLDVGCVRITERFLHSDPPTDVELDQAVATVHDHLESVSLSVPGASEVSQMVLLVGAVTSVAAVKARLSECEDDHGGRRHLLRREAVEDLLRSLASTKVADRSHESAFEQALADVIIGGTVILAAILRYFDFESCLVSDADILHGVVLSLLDDVDGIG